MTRKLWTPTAIVIGLLVTPAVAQAGSVTAQPGSVTAQSGSVTAQPGSVTAQPGSVTAQPGSVTAQPGPAPQAAVGYVRLAHLSPDTPAVDVYLTPVSGALDPKVFRAVGYGAVSPYLSLPPGTYTVAMRAQGTPASAAPVLSTQVTVVAGAAYTVAGVGRYADLGLRVLRDDLARPPAGRAKVRVVQASVRVPLLDVGVRGGAGIGTGVPFATTTGYRQVTPGTWTLRLGATGSSAAVMATAKLRAGGVYSLIVVDGADGALRVEVRTDAEGGATAPTGGVETGAGGTA